MIVTTVIVAVNPKHLDDFIKATIKNHEASVKETGNRRFDVLQSPDDPGKFLLYEAYDTTEQAVAHKNTAHYLEWKKTVEPFMTAPRQGVPYSAIRPL
jgi:(4S)-4-hydroxy-5-phosphonooxypentane-2,3-dione isomerase